MVYYLHPKHSFHVTQPGLGNVWDKLINRLFILNMFKQVEQTKIVFSHLSTKYSTVILDLYYFFATYIACPQSKSCTIPNFHNVIINTPNANRANRSVVARDELHESEVSEALKMLLQKTLALYSICSVLFRCAYELLCFWMRQEGIEIFHRSPLWENNGSMQFFETEKWPEMEFMIAAGTKVCLLRFRIEDLRKIV